MASEIYFKNESFYEESTMELVIAINQNDILKIMLLLHEGANINGRFGYNDDKTPLSFAVEENIDTAVLSLLIESGADVNHIRNESRLSILSLAVANANADPGIVELLLKHGANPNHASKYGESILKTAIDKQADVEVINLLLNYGANPKRCSDIGYVLRALYYKYNIDYKSRIKQQNNEQQIER